MKGNIKKLVVLVIIAAIAMLTVVAMASADDHSRKAPPALPHKAGPHVQETAQ